MYTHNYWSFHKISPVIKSDFVVLFFLSNIEILKKYNIKLMFNIIHKIKIGNETIKISTELI